MLRQTKLILNVILRGFFGLNEALYDRNRTKKRRAEFLLVTFILAGIVIIVYTCALSYGLTQLGLAQAVPTYLFTVSSILILFFALFMAGDTVFNMKTYEKLIVLPVKPSVIIVSRFLSVYIVNAIIGALLMISGSAVFALTSNPPLYFYFSTIISIVILPLLPMTVATIISAVIIAISSRMKHIKAVRVALSMILVVSIIVLSTVLSSKMTVMTQQSINDLAMSVYENISKIYPLAKLFAQSALNGSIVSLLILVAISVAVFSVFVLITQKYFVSICTVLNTGAAKRRFVMTQQSESTPLAALYKKELKRYFSSNIYIMNTSLGYILAVVLSVSVLIMGADKINSLFGMEGIIQKIAPMFLALLYIVAVPTTCSISMEGKQWWIAQSLPVAAKTVYMSKLFVGLTISLPSLLAEILMCIAVRPDFAGCVIMLLLPSAYVIFSNAMGLYVNIKMPLLNWESETTAVKQSGAVMVAMLIGFVSVAIPIAALFAAPQGYAPIISAVTFVAISAAAAIFIHACNKTPVIKVG